MKILKGIESFNSKVFPGMKGDFARLESGQSPETLFITCSDSRIDPALLCQSAPGEIFVIRNAGNIVPLPGKGELGVEATVQYAVDVLKVSQIVVCGHSHCGAVTGLLNRDSLESLPVIRDWVNHSEKVLEQIKCCETEVPKAIRANVLLQLDHLQEHECVAKALAGGSLELHGWVYHFEKGEVEIVSAENDAV